MGDSFLWYNVGAWGPYGLALPNPGKSPSAGRALNRTVRYLVETIGRNLQAVMERSDVNLRVPPSINTLALIHKLCVRARDVLASRVVPASQFRQETAHATPAPEDFLFFPTRFYTVENPWLKEFAGYILLALTEAMQHQERAEPIEISESFAASIGQWIHRVYRLMAVELLRVPREQAEKLDFTLTDEQLKSYNPTAWFSSTELNDTVRAWDAFTTEDDRDLLSRGIPYSHLPVLGTWPTASLAGAPVGGVSGATTAAAAGSSFLAPPSP